MRSRFWCMMALSLSLLLGAATSARPSEQDEWPHIKDIKKCPRCAAPFDGTPHPLDYRQCPKCQAALEKAMGYVKKHFKPSMFGLLLDSFYGGFAFMMDSEPHEKELALCAKNCRDMIKPEPDGNFASANQIGGDWFSWKKSMAMFFLTEYSLRFGLTPENKAALIDGAKVATDNQEKGGGWFHSKPHEGQYSPDIAIIGCIFYASFQEMKALGIDPGPIMDQTRTYLESISDGKTIGYSKGWHGGMGGGGADGFLTLGFQGSGNGDDKWGAGLANWMKANYMDAGHGHANGELHYFGLGAGLHRLGSEYYAKFATCHIHRLIEVQHEDGSIPGMSHDDSNEVAFFEKQKADMITPGDFTATSVLACLILMERPGAFSSLPSKPAGSISNKDAFKNGNEALEKYDYGKAYKNFALVLPRGDSGELIPQAREQMRKIDAIAKQRILELQAKDADLAAKFKDKPDSKEELVAYADKIHEYEKFQKDFDSCPATQDVARLVEPLHKLLSNKRMRMAYSTNTAPTGGTSTAATGKLKNADAQKNWDGKLKDRIKAVVAAGGKPRFEFKSLGTRLTILGLPGNDSMKVQMEGGGQMDLNWTQLQAGDICSLALELASSQDTPGDHALAAFYLLRGKETAKAEDHLTKAGKEGADVRAAFVTD